MPIETGSYDRPAYRRRMNMEHRLVTLCCISGYRDGLIHPLQRMNMVVIQRKSFAAAIGMGIARYLSDVVSTFQSFPPPLIRWNHFQRFFLGSQMITTIDHAGCRVVRCAMDCSASFNSLQEVEPRNV